jgi:Mn2+/Fe2+ NRAMP family transporter
MKQLLSVTLGVLTSVGGWLEIGTLAAAISGGAQFGFKHVWVALLGGVCLIFLVEMAGRFTAVSGETVSHGLRKRFSFGWFLVPLIAFLTEMLATLAAEIAGISISLELVSGVSYRIWAPVGALFVWLLLRSAAFPKIEKAISLFGLVTIVFVVAALVLRPPWREVAAGLIPSSPALGRAEYWFLAVALIGSSLSPCMLFFYSAGAREEKWDNSQLRANRLVAGLGMGFGTLMSIAAIVAAGVAYPRGTEIEDYTELPEVLEVPFGPRWGQWLFALALLAGSLGGAIVVTMVIGYLAAEAFGWGRRSGSAAGERGHFTRVYTVALAIGALVIMSGIDPLKLTLFAMAATALTLPFGVYPFLVLMREERYLGKDHRNGWLGTGFVAATLGAACLVAAVAIPLAIVGGG